MGHPYDVFLVHPSRLKPEARALAASLRGAGLRPVLDESDLQPGVPYPDALQAAQRAARCSAILPRSDLGELGPYVG